jgi:hypothetical protein
MLSLQFKLQLQTALSFAPHEAPFKGGVLHGFFENALTEFHPQLWANLRGPRDEPARYALRVPQCSSPRWPAGHAFVISVTLFAPVQHLWGDVVAALTQGPPLRLGCARVPCTAQDVRILRPAAPSLSLLQAASHVGQGLADWQAQRPVSSAAQAVVIKLLAPCLISSEARRMAQPAPAPPLPLTLSSIVSSLKRRMQRLEPALASQYAFDSPAWREAERSTWPHQIPSANPAHTQVTPRPWPYAAATPRADAPSSSPPSKAT